MIFGLLPAVPDALVGLSLTWLRRKLSFLLLIAEKPCIWPAVPLHFDTFLKKHPRSQTSQICTPVGAV